MAKKITGDAQVERFLKYIERQLDRKNLSVIDISKMIDTPRATIYSWLNREAVMSLEKYYRLLKALNLKAEYFTTDNDGEILDVSELA